MDQAAEVSRPPEQPPLSNVVRTESTMDEETRSGRDSERAGWDRSATDPGPIKLREGRRPGSKDTQCAPVEHAISWYLSQGRRAHTASCEEPIRGQNPMVERGCSSALWLPNEHGDTSGGASVEGNLYPAEPGVRVASTRPQRPPHPEHEDG